jgi:hypothetical protein
MERVVHCVWLYFRFNLSYPDVEEIQVSGKRAAFSIGLRNHYLTLQSGRHLYRAGSYRAVMKSRFAVWEEANSIEAIVN